MVRIREAHYIQIVRFKFAEQKAAALANDVQTHLESWISQCSGFISANLHVSEDGKHMINYAQWRDKESFDAFTKHESQEALKESIQSHKPESIESDHFDLVAQQSVEDEFWSKSRI